jgi:hypothetical protein
MSDQLSMLAAQHQIMRTSHERHVALHSSTCPAAGSLMSLKVCRLSTLSKSVNTTVKCTFCMRTQHHALEQRYVLNKEVLQAQASHCVHIK